MDINQNGYDGFTLDVSIWKNRQAKYLVHGIDDVYWINTIDEVLQVFKQELERIDSENELAIRTTTSE